jgi:hypothetical protein
MKALYKSLALGGTLLTIVPPILLLTDAIDLDTNKTLMVIGMVLWYLGATPWLGIEHKEEVPGEDTHPKI